MSIIFQANECFLLSHKAAVNQTFAAKTPLGAKFSIRDELFEINVPYMRDNQPEVRNTESKKREKIKRKKDKAAIDQHPVWYELITNVSKKYDLFMGKCRQLGLLQSSESVKNNFRAQKLALEVQSAVDGTKVLSGRNNTDIPIISQIGQDTFLIPPYCKFFQNDVLLIDNLLPNSNFDFVSIDPPWWNKYVRRARNANSKSGYPMLDSDAILSIPLEKAIAANSLVAIWCTNSPAHISLIKEKLVVKWQLQLLSTWYWVKITQSGHTVCDFGLPLQKQPFEQLFVACHVDSDMERFTSLVDSRYVFSVPSAVHSHKPPILDLFTNVLPDSPKCMEVFARYLMPNFTSIGLEVLKLQNICLFEEI